MFFELEGITYRIKFYRMGMTTIAELYEVNPDPVDDADPAMFSLGVFGIARPHYTDRFEKKTGRKVALENLLMGLSDHVDKDGNLILSTGPITLQKSDREAIWTKYFEHHKK